MKNINKTMLNGKKKIKEVINNGYTFYIFK